MASPEQLGRRPEEGDINRRQFLERFADEIVAGAVTVTGAIGVDGAFEKDKSSGVRITRGVVGSAAILAGIYLWVTKPIESMRARERTDPNAKNRISPPPRK
jgi:hypothetical protein